MTPFTAVRRATGVGLLAVCFCATSPSAQAPSAEAADARLLATARLWVTVKFFHPFLAYRPVLDWDRALVDALPGIVAAKSPAEYQAAVNSMLDALHDPETFARLTAAPAAAPRPAAERPTSSQNDLLSLAFEATGDNNARLTVGPGPATSTGPKATADAADLLVSEIDKSSAVVFDLRPSPGRDPQLLSALLDLPGVRGHLSTKPLAGAAQRSWMHAGLAPEIRREEYGYYSAFVTHQSPTFPPDGPERSLSIEFLVGQGSVLPEIGAALVSERRADLKADSPAFTIAHVGTISVPMGEGVTAKVRLTEFIAGDGTAIDSQHTPLASSPTPRPPAFDPAVRYPSREYRLLAAFKTWGAIKYFYAYRDQMDEDWDKVFADSLPAIENAKDAREYHLAIASLITHLHDSQALVESAELSDYYGAAPAPLRVRLIDQKPVVTHVLDDAAREAGVKVGDIVLKVDGEDIVERVNREARYVSASTQQSLGLKVMSRLLNGPEGSTATLRLRGTGGIEKEVQLTRHASFAAAMSHTWRDGPVMKILTGNIGYADLDRLTAPQVDEMFTKFHAAKAIIFDLRGSPQGTAAPIASRLARSEDSPAAMLNGPLLFSPDLSRNGVASSNANYFEIIPVPLGASPRYEGKTVMLVDERTGAEAEQAGLLLEAANRTAVIGGPSAGSNGDPTNFVLPGGITVSFSGHDIRHGNSGQLQRLGLQPELLVLPTIQGVRQGRDEVLEKALAHLAQ
jgi:C-terminal processing protease CtpA/Prc